MAVPHVLNVNVGVLGHVDSGKTSLGAWQAECVLKMAFSFPAELYMGRHAGQRLSQTLAITALSCPYPDLAPLSARSGSPLYYPVHSSIGQAPSEPGEGDYVGLGVLSFHSESFGFLYHSMGLLY